MMGRMTKRGTGRNIADQPGLRMHGRVRHSLVALILTALGCSAPNHAGMTFSGSNSELWVALSGGNGVIDSKHFFKCDGEACFRSRAPKLDPFTVQNDRQQELATDFQDQWRAAPEGGDEEARYLYLLVAPTGDRAVPIRFDTIRGPVRDLPNGLKALPNIYDARFKLPVAWHPAGELLAAGLFPRRGPHGMASEIVVFNVETADISRRIKPMGGRLIEDAAWNPEGTALAILTVLSREGSGFLDWVGSAIGHGVPNLDYVLEIHSFIGKPTLEIPVVEGVDFGTAHVVWPRRTSPVNE